MAGLIEELGALAENASSAIASKISPRDSPTHMEEGDAKTAAKLLETKERRRVLREAFHAVDRDYTGMVDEEGFASACGAALQDEEIADCVRRERFGEETLAALPAALFAAFARRGRVVCRHHLLAQSRQLLLLQRRARLRLRLRLRL